MVLGLLVSKSAKCYSIHSSYFIFQFSTIVLESVIILVESIILFRNYLENLGQIPQNICI